MSAQRLLPAGRVCAGSGAEQIHDGAQVKRYHKQGRKSEGLQLGQNTKSALKACPWVIHFGGWSQPQRLGTARQPKKLLLQESVQPYTSTQRMLF